MDEKNIISVDELEIMEWMKTYLKRCGLLTVELIVSIPRDDLEKKYKLNKDQINALYIAIDNVTSTSNISKIGQWKNERVDRIVQMVAERYKLTESSARAKVMSKSSQMVLTAILEIAKVSILWRLQNWNCVKTH